MMSPHWYRAEALRRWPTAGDNILSFGRWALVARRDGEARAVYLFADKEIADKSTLFYDSKVHDLEPLPSGPLEKTIGWEDARERRARRNEIEERKTT